MYCVRRICGSSAWGGTESNHEIRVRYPSLETIICYHRLRWLGCVVWLGPERLPIQVLFGWIEGKRPRGRTRKTWIDAVLDDIGIISELNGKRRIFLEWQKLHQDRAREERRDLSFGRYTHLILGLETCKTQS